MTTTSRPKGALAQALYCKLNHDLQMEANFDYQSWYSLGKKVFIFELLCTS